VKQAELVGRKIARADRAREIIGLRPLLAGATA